MTVIIDLDTAVKHFAGDREREDLHVFKKPNKNKSTYTMSGKESMMDRAKERLNKMRASMEDMNLQMHLGAKEAKDEFEKQKGNLSTWAEATSKKVGEMKGVSEEKVSQMKQALDELRVQAALGRAEGKEAMEEQQKNLTSTLATIKTRMADLYESSEEGVKSFADQVEDKLEDYHTRFDMLKVQVHLGKQEVESAWEERKKDISQKITELSKKIDEQTDKTEDAWDHFSNEIKESWTHLRKAFGGGDD